MKLKNKLLITIGSCDTNIILNYSNLQIDIEKSKKPKPTYLICWSPNCEMYFTTIKNIAGNIIEISDTINSLNSDDNIIPIGSLVITHFLKDTDEFICKYCTGMFNNDIEQIMKLYKIKDYQLPDLIKK